MRGACCWLALLLLLLALGGCAAAGVDPADEARQVLDGFREASPTVADLLDEAAAWAVFPGGDYSGADCTHAGTFFARDLPPRPCRLRCSTRPDIPGSPGGVAFHQLVILMDAQDLARLEGEPLDLTGAALVAPHDQVPRDGGGRARWVVSTARETLLFEAVALPYSLELE